MVKKNLPIGIDDFKEVIENNYYFVDKSMLIDELLSKKSKVVLIPRPRRFGKTLNMSMLNYFFDIENRESNRKLFDDLAIVTTDKMKFFGQNPVIYISLKDIKVDNWELCNKKLYLLLQAQYDKHGLIL
ncbi:MAG: AAA family ATPase, partial [Anaeroplasmataceae bacterium]